MPSTFNFNDLTLREKASVSYEDLTTRFLRFEMMQAGVSKPIPPDYLPIPEKPAYESFTAYELQSKNSSTGIFFRDPEALAGFMALEPGIATENWYLQHYQNLQIRGLDDGEQFTLKPVQVVDSRTFGQLNSWDAEKRKAEDANKALEKDFNASNEGVNEILERLTDSWRQATRKVGRFQNILATRDEYLRMAGTLDVAMTFLAKAFLPGEIEEALAFEKEAAPAEA